MKKLSVLMLGLFTLMAFSFFKNAQTGPLRKIGKDLYESKTASALKPADQEKIKTILAKHYGIKSFKETVTVHYTPTKGGKGTSIAEQSLGNSAFIQSLIENGETEEVKQKGIYSDNATNPNIGDVAQVLSAYNVH